MGLNGTGGDRTHHGHGDLVSPVAWRLPGLVQYTRSANRLATTIVRICDATV
jgi:hypothetical protein